MAKQLLLLLFSFCICKSYAQNLLANGSFEDRNICLEYHTGCAPEAWFRVPLSAVTASGGTAGYLMGNRFESLVMENISHPLLFRSFIYTRLLCALEKGKVYRFRASCRTEETGFDHVDVIMLPFEPYRNKRQLAIAKEKFTITPQQQVRELAGNWIEYLYEFTATGDERYLVIGNFSKEILPVKKEQRYLINVIYDIDNISLSPADSTLTICPEWKANKTKLYQNNLRHTAFNYLDDEDEISVTEPPQKNTPIAVMPSIPVVNDTLVVPDVLFKFDKTELNPAFAGRLDTLISKIKSRVFKRIEVLGHTDSLGTDAYNQRLSLNRAITVKKYLIDQLHYPEDKIVAKSFAATLPVSTNRTKEGRQRNRRVEIVLNKN
jgi:outer membrane protein OmpA-like peptidoglycan-associated protein